MANLDFVVDTTPMANRVDRMTTGVISVQSAVHVMEDEIVKSEQDAAKKNIFQRHIWLLYVGEKPILSEGDCI